MYFSPWTCLRSLSPSLFSTIRFTRGLQTVSPFQSRLLQRAVLLIEKEILWKVGYEWAQDSFGTLQHSAECYLLQSMRKMLVGLSTCHNQHSFKLKNEELLGEGVAQNTKLLAYNTSHPGRWSCHHPSQKVQLKVKHFQPSKIVPKRLPLQGSKVGKILLQTVEVILGYTCQTSQGNILKGYTLYCKVLSVVWKQEPIRILQNHVKGLA